MQLSLEGKVAFLTFILPPLALLKSLLAYKYFHVLENNQGIKGEGYFELMFVKKVDRSYRNGKHENRIFVRNRNFEWGGKRKPNVKHCYQIPAAIGRAMEATSY